MSDKLARVIVTTDMEVDDMNSTIHLALYLNLLDVEAIVYTSSQYHFQGDGEHTLAEVNPHWRTKGVRSYEGEKIQGPDPEAGKLMSYRPFPDNWIEDLWANEYALAWPYLQRNAEAPSFTRMGELFKEKTENPNPFLRAYQEDFAVRAQWCASEPDECNHAPQILSVSNDLVADAGDTAELGVSVFDPDGDALSCIWRCYEPDGTASWEAKGPVAAFPVPADAPSGTRYVLTLTVRDLAERPATRYAQVAVDVR